MECCLDIFSRVPDTQTAWHMVADAFVLYALGDMTVFYPQFKAGKKETEQKENSFRDPFMQA